MARSRLENVLLQLTLQEKLSNIHIQYKNASDKTDGYVGEIVFVDIIGTKNQEEIVYNLAVKCEKPAPDQVMRKILHKICINECYVYKVVLNEFQKFEIEYKVPTPFKSVAKYFISHEDDSGLIIVLQNLKATGFKLWDRKKAMNIEHLNFVFKEYAKFHAISLAMSKLVPDKFAKMANQLRDSDMVNYFVRFKKSVEKFLIKLANQADKMQKFEVANTLRSYSTTITDKMKTAVSNLDAFSVITHGDCWTNNLMFQYQEKDKTTPSKMCFLDFQLACYTSPALDLVYFFYACSLQEIFKNNETFINVYYDALKSHLSYYCADNILSLKKLKTEWKRCAIYAFAICTLVFKNQAIDDDEAPDILDRTDEGRESIDTFFAECSKTEEINKRLILLAEHLIENESF